MTIVVEHWCMATAPAHLVTWIRFWCMATALAHLATWIRSGHGLDLVLSRVAVAPKISVGGLGGNLGATAVMM